MLMRLSTGYLVLVGHECGTEPNCLSRTKGEYFKIHAGYHMFLNLGILRNVPRDPGSRVSSFLVVYFYRLGRDMARSLKKKTYEGLGWEVHIE